MQGQKETRKQDKMSERAAYKQAIADLLNRVVDEEPSKTKALLGCYSEEVAERETVKIVRSLPVCPNRPLQCRNESEGATPYTLLWSSEQRETGEFALGVSSVPLPLGDVALIPENLASKTRVNSHAAHLDAAQWTKALKQVSVDDLIHDLGRERIVRYTRMNEVAVGTNLSSIESEIQGGECRFPLKTPQEKMPKWPLKMFNQQLIPLLNGASKDEAVQLWLGVVRDKTLLMIGSLIPMKATFA